MNYTNNIWLLVGRETDGNNTKNYILMDYNGCTQFVQKRSIAKFCREHEVINVQLSGDSITGKGIAITALPRYVKQQGFGLQQVSGVSQAEVIQMAQPLINQYMQKKEAAQQRKEANSPEAQKAKQNEYVINKLIAIEDLVVTALAMKDITNELASSEHITRYIKQIDIDNAEGDSLDNLIKRQGVNGLVNGLLLRLDKLNIRITKYNLDKNLRNQISKLKNSCNDIKELHERTKKIIKDNKSEDTKQKILLEKQSTEMDSIPVVDDTTDMIAVDFAEDGIPIVDDVGVGAIEVEYSDSLEIGSIEDIFKTPELTKEDKEIKEKVDNLCEIYSRAVTTMGNIIHNPKRVAEIAHALDMEYPGVHNKITKDKINSHYNSEEEVIQAISEHYDYITKEDNSSNIWQSLLHNHLGKSGNEIYRLVFTRDVDIDDTNLNKHQELFDFYIQTLIGKIVAQLNTDKEQCIQKALQNFTSSDNKEMIRDRINALADLRNVFSNEIVYQAFSISNRYKGITDYNTELSRLEKSFNEGEFIISYVNNESLHMSVDMSANALRELGSRYSIIYDDIKSQIKGIKQRFRGSAFDLKDNPYHPSDFINYMYCIHSTEIESQTESMCNNGGWDYVTARNNARRNIINSYYTDDNTRTYYDLCNEIIKNFCNLHE